MSRIKSASSLQRKPSRQAPATSSSAGRLRTPTIRRPRPERFCNRSLGSYPITAVHHLTNVSDGAFLPVGSLNHRGHREPQEKKLVDFYDLTCGSMKVV